MSLVDPVDGIDVHRDPAVATIDQPVRHVAADTSAVWARVKWRDVGSIYGVPGAERVEKPNFGQTIADQRDVRFRRFNLCQVLGQIPEACACWNMGNPAARRAGDLLPSVA